MAPRGAGGYSPTGMVWWGRGRPSGGLFGGVFEHGSGADV